MTSVARALNTDQSNAIALGRDVRGMRKSRGLTLSELAMKIGRSIGFISQLERGLSSPSIDDLRAISTALDVPLGWFFAHDSMDERERGVIVRADCRRSLGTEESGLVEELLSPDLGGKFEMFRSEFQPGGKSQDSIIRETEEAGVVVSGTLDLWIDGTFHTLQTGDSFRFENKPYRWRNVNNEPAIVIWVVSPPTY